MGHVDSIRAGQPCRREWPEVTWGPFLGWSRPPRRRPGCVFLSTWASHLYLNLLRATAVHGASRMCYGESSDKSDRVAELTGRAARRRSSRRGPTFQGVPCGPGGKGTPACCDPPRASRLQRPTKNRATCGGTRVGASGANPANFAGPAAACGPGVSPLPRTSRHESVKFSRSRSVPWDLLHRGSPCGQRMSIGLPWMRRDFTHGVALKPIRRQRPRRGNRAGRHLAGRIRSPARRFDVVSRL